MTDTNVEFNRPVALEELRGGVDRRIEATEQERARLAQRFGLQAIGSLTARVALESSDRGAVVAVRGDFAADVVQTCVVTLEPVAAHLAEDFAVRLAVGPGPAGPKLVDLDPAAEDEPEPIDGDNVDIGEIVAQHLSLALDPYPRAPGARFEPDDEADEGPQDGPFAKLATLKRNP